ncbi:uncharacterized protein LOC128093592 [Culex pipiens pallens]|uniref:uncharacterized protein LOC128093592 n=1 Tax=Culex pipiens pallens TaxID=42434 RepID=UPI0022AA0AA9|nr:uncharacterized protein LOC128093592 [Culex pipiens pallens]
MKYRNSLGLIVQIQFRTFLQIKESPHRKRGFGGDKAASSRLGRSGCQQSAADWC